MLNPDRQPITIRLTIDWTVSTCIPGLKNWSVIEKSEADNVEALYLFLNPYITLHFNVLAMGTESIKW
jgi:hypothetical protein